MDKDHEKDFIAVMNFLGHAEDRMFAIIAMAYCETYLGELIKARMPGLNSHLRKKLFDPDRVIGPASARIDIAQALSIISPEFADDLKLIASIRNKFAHDISINSCDAPYVSERIARLRTSPKLEGGPKDAQKSADKMFQEMKNRDKFQMVAFLICNALHLAMVDLKAKKVF